MKTRIFSTVLLQFVCIFAPVIGIPQTFSIDPVVKVSQGFVRGIVANSTKGRLFFSFRGIPYGEPPVGDLRFKAPIEASRWYDIFNATDNPVSCTQPTGPFWSVIGDEDCLNLNVYTPSLIGGEIYELLPVLVFIHGGGFSSGTTSSDAFGPDRYMNKDVVVVLMNYRLGAFGFLSTGDDAASGNWGLLDQVLALKWIQTNIATFGGDAGRVTISGQSAGAASVIYQVISPAAKGLFRGAIAESGTAISIWALQRNPLASAICLGNLLGCETNDTNVLVDCLRQTDAATLVKATIEIQTCPDIPAFPFLPVVENNKTGQFLTEHPITLLERGQFNKVPVISGTNKDDGALTYETIQYAYKDINEIFFNDTLPTILHALLGVNSSFIDLSYAIKAEYYDKIDITNASQVARASIDLSTDAGFTASNYQTINLLSSSGLPVYAYVFGYQGSASKYNYSGEVDVVSHSNELAYLFNTGVVLNDQDQALSEALIDMWINFTYTLVPTSNGIWQQKTKVDNNYLIITQDFKMQNGYRTKQMEFWTTKMPEIMELMESTELPITKQPATEKSKQIPQLSTELPITELHTTGKSKQIPQLSTESPITGNHHGSGNSIHISQFLIIVSISLLQ